MSSPLLGQLSDHTSWQNSPPSPAKDASKEAVEGCGFIVKVMLTHLLNSLFRTLSGSLMELGKSGRRTVVDFHFGGSNGDKKRARERVREREREREIERER